MSKFLLLSVASAIAVVGASPASAVVTFARYTVAGQSFAWTNQDQVAQPRRATTIAAAIVPQSPVGAAQIAFYAARAGLTQTTAAINTVVPAATTVTPSGTLTKASYTVTTPAYTYKYNPAGTARTRTNVATASQALNTLTSSFIVNSNAGNVSNIATAGNPAAYSTATKVKFSYVGLPSSQVGQYLSPFVTNVDAYLIISATSTTPAQSGFGSFGQFTQNGSFSIVAAGPLTVGSQSFLIGEDLLSGAFTNAVLTGQANASSGSFAASTLGGATLTFNSNNFLDFSNVVNTDMAIALTSISPGLVRTYGTGSLRSFRASAVGEFSSDPAPIVVGVPEPEVWGLLVVGFGLVGVQVRRRNRQSAVAA